MHGRNRTVTPAMFAHIKMRRLRKFSSCLALRHASWRAISQWRPGHDGDGNGRDNAYSSFQLAPLFRVFPVLKKIRVFPVLKKRSPGQLGRGQLARLFRPCCLGDKRPWSQTRSAGFRCERCNTARCPECDGKQEILRSSELSEFSTGRVCCGRREFRKERPASSLH
jgi:hypothetical protein